MPEDGTPPWARFVDAAFVHVIAADVHGQLGEHDHAHEYAELAIDTVSDGCTKTRALILAQAACTGASTNDFDLVEQTAYEAADLTGKLESIQARRKLRLLGILLKPYGASIFAQRLMERLNTLPE